MLWIRRAHNAALAVVAAAVTLSALAYEYRLGKTGLDPLWDPEISYLMNSLLPFKGRTYTFVDHPGTPVEIVGTVLMALTWPVARGGEGFVDFHLRDPALFLALAHGLLTLGSLAVMVMVARRSLPLERGEDVALSLALAVAFFALHPHAPGSLVYWSHNSFAFPAGGGLSLALWLRLRRPEPLGRRWTMGLGAATGVLTAAQLYFGAWTVGFAVAAAAAARQHGQSWRRVVAAAAMACSTAAAAFVLVTLPIAPHYGRFVRFIVTLLRHRGPYGSGAAGAPALDHTAANLTWLVQQTPLLFVLLGVALLALAAGFVAHRLDLRRAGDAPAALGLAVQAIVVTLVIAVHPRVEYAQAIAAVLPVLLAIAYRTWRPSRWPARAVAAALAVALLAHFANALADRVTLRRHWFLSLRGGHEELRWHRARIAAENGHVPGQELTMWTFGTQTPCYALWVGDYHAQRAFTREVSRVCPFEGAVWDGMAALPEGWRARDGADPVHVVTVDGILAAQPALAALGTPIRTHVLSLEQGAYVVIPTRLNDVRRLRPLRALR
jgi:hypothetical protein